MIHGHNKTAANIERGTSSSQASSLSTSSDFDNRWPFPIDVNCIPGAYGGESLTTSHVVEQIINGNEGKSETDMLHYWIFWVEAMCAAASLNLQFMFMVDELHASV
eukprot:scaffold43658_cov46-Attheya_sp.AAC.1